MLKIKINFTIRKIRKQKHISLVYLAIESGISKSHISDIERGKRMPSILVLCALAYALKCKVDDLYECYYE